jgi:hypothetical protein
MRHPNSRILSIRFLILVWECLRRCSATWSFLRCGRRKRFNTGNPDHAESRFLGLR